MMSKKKEIRNDDVKNGVIKVEKDKIVNEKKDIEMINKISHQKELIKIDDSNINQKIINLNNNKKINNNKINDEKIISNINKNNFETMRTKVKMINRSKKKSGVDLEFFFKYKKNNVLNINDTYNIEVNDNVFVLKDVEFDSYFNFEEVKYELIFEKEGNLYAWSREYKKILSNIRHQLLRLNLMGEINVKLHIIDEEVGLYLSHIYYNPSCKLKIKDKWIWWDGYHWYYITKIEEISDEQLIREIAFVY